MADWADISNLWWLRPQRSDEGNSLLAGVQVGAQLRQQKLSNELAFKRMALENQYRQDVLEYQNKRVDAVIDSYDQKLKQAEKTQEDMDTISSVLPQINAGEPFTLPKPLNLPQSGRVLASLEQAAARKRSAERLTATELKIQQDLRDQLEYVGKYAPTAYLSLKQRLDSNNGNITGEMGDEIKSAYREFVVPELEKPKPGMEIGSIQDTLPGGKRIVHVRPHQEFKAGEREQDFVARRIAQMEQSDQRAVANAVPGTKIRTPEERTTAARKEWQLSHETDEETSEPESATVTGPHYIRENGKLKLVP